MNSTNASSVASGSVVASGSSFVIVDESSFFEPMRFKRIDFSSESASTIMSSTVTSSEQSAHEDNLEDAASQTLKNYKYGFYVCIGLLVLSLIALCFAWSKIELMIAILKSAALFVMDVWPAVFIPPIFYVLFVFYFTWWVATCLFLYTSGDLDETNTYPFGQFTMDKKAKYMFGYFVFGGLWCFALLIAI